MPAYKPRLRRVFLPVPYAAVALYWTSWGSKLIQTSGFGTGPCGSFQPASLSRCLTPSSSLRRQGRQPQSQMRSEETDRPPCSQQLAAVRFLFFLIFFFGHLKGQTG